jgi:hypothetical protein
MHDYVAADYILSIPLLPRLEIPVGAAKGLAFLHEADKPLVHGHFRASCVLIYPVSFKLLV